MTALSLKRIVEEALAEVGANINFALVPRGKVRTTTWLGIEHGFGIRHYASGRNVYIVQTRMAGRLRTVTLGPASVLPAIRRRWWRGGLLPTRKWGMIQQRNVSVYARPQDLQTFLAEYWTRWSPTGKHRRLKP
ncbi:MAG: hypothetical protein IPI83_13505 [Sphingomonadales bacterium]|nr:hypothetical protein [Sphingomonadales bacterium]